MRVLKDPSIAGFRVAEDRVTIAGVLSSFDAEIGQSKTPGQCGEFTQSNQPDELVISKVSRRSRTASSK